ncbi:hypothetical protein D3C78_1515860 [compost metagenome]
MALHTLLVTSITNPKRKPETADTIITSKSKYELEYPRVCIQPKINVLVKNEITKNIYFINSQEYNFEKHIRKMYMIENIAAYRHTSTEPDLIAENIEYPKSSTSTDFKFWGFVSMTIFEVISLPIQRTK